MEKYTVDLDKVLNDFEFSEYSLETAKISKNHCANNFPPNHAVDQSSNISRHSINNVFHSLNEYIGLEVQPVFSENCITNNINDTSVELISVKDELGSTFLEVNDPFIDKTENVIPVIETNLNSSSDDQNLTESHSLIDNNEDNECKENFKDDACVENNTPNNEISLSNVKFKDNTVDIAENEETKAPPEISDAVHQEKETNPIDHENVSEEMPIKLEKLEEVAAAIDADRDDLKDSQELKSREELKTSDEIKNNEETKSSEELKCSEELKNSEKMKNLEDGVDECTKLSQEPQIDKTTLHKAQGETVAVGFHDDIEIDEDNLDEYFDTLEKEVKGDENGPVDDVQKNKIDRPHDLDLELSTAEDRGVLIGEPGSTPFNNVIVSAELDETKAKRPISPTYSTVSTVSISSSSGNSSRELESDEAKGNSDQEEKAVAENGSAKNEDFSEPQIEPDVSTVEPVDAAVVNDSNDDSSKKESENSTDRENPIGDSLASSDFEESVLPSSELLGKRAPLWIPDADTISCMHCDTKFTVIKRRHHCRACGLVLCSKCCGLKYRLDYLDCEARVCNKCYDVLNHRDANGGGESIAPSSPSAQRVSSPNPNNPAEYCSTVPPHMQQTSSDVPKMVMVPVGVLKRKGSNKSKHNKSVMFCDGIRPGSDLTNLDTDFDYASAKRPLASCGSSDKPFEKIIDPETLSFIPSDVDFLPPTVVISKADISYASCKNNAETMEIVKNEQLTFALQCNVFVHVKIVDLECCVCKKVWCFSTEGLVNVGQDEIIILLECLSEETSVPKDIFMHLNHIYLDAVKGNSVKELGLSLADSKHPFLNSRNHAGFVYIKPSFQCLQNIIVPKEPYLIGILIHRWETPWAKLFPLRLVLRLGAEYRYYPCPIISSRLRDSVFVEVGHTIINLLADFRDFTYSLAQIRGLFIHMEDKLTTIHIPSNRYDQVMKAINDSSDHILAFAGNFSPTADCHLVCIQDTQSTSGGYTTHAININNKPRRVCGASFVVFNGSLKTNSGLTAKSSIVEDGLMIHILPERMTQLRDDLRNMKDHTIECGCVDSASDETVSIVWKEADTNFNTGVLSPIDNCSLSGKPSIRVHNGKDYVCNSGNRLIRWTEVFIIQSEDESGKNQDPIDISKISESIAKAVCEALVRYLDLLVSNSFYKIGIRAMLHVENVSYLAGSNNVKLPPIYMKSLDNELIPVLHRITLNNGSDGPVVLELIFRILNFA